VNWRVLKDTLEGLARVEGHTRTLNRYESTVKVVWKSNYELVNEL